MKNKFLVLLAGVSAFTLVACAGNKDDKPVTSETTTPPTIETEEPTPQKEVKAEFKGTTKIDGVDYNVVLSAYKDGTFLLNPGKDVKQFEGTYEFIEGTGYVFKLNDANKTVVESVWNAEEKNHEATFTLKLGDAGTGTVTVKLHDDTFVHTVKPAKEVFLDRAKFTGVLNYNGEYNFESKFNNDGTFELVPDKMANMLTKKGTYTYENNTFTLKCDNKEFKSTFDITTGLFTIPFMFKGPEAELPLNLTFDSRKPNQLKASSERLGGVSVELKMAADGTCVFDVTTKVNAFPGIQEAFDAKGTWDHLGPRYKFTVKQVNPQTNEEVEKVYEGDYDETNNTIKLNYDITGPEGKIDFIINGEFPQLQRLHCYEDSDFGKLAYDLIFLPDGKAWLKCTTPHPARNGNYDDRGTFTFVDNVLTFNKEAEPHDEEPAIAEDAETYVAEWNEETGTYSITYNLHLKRISKVFHPIITYTVY